MILDTQVQNIVFDDLLDLIDKMIQENLYLEFKREPYGVLKDGEYKLHKEDKREMLKDITGMANAEGGHIIIGIDEDKWGKAAKLLPIPNPYEIKKRMIDICNQGIQNPIEGIQIHVVEKTLGRDGFLILRVPSSALKPHMVSIHGYASFFIRIDNTVQPMQIGQIKHAFISSPTTKAILQGASPFSEEKIPIRGVEEYLPYIEVIADRPAQRFWSRFLRADINPQSLLVVSPYIGKFEGYPVEFEKILDKCKEDSIRMHVVTQTPTDQYHVEAIQSLSEVDLVDIRYVDELHAKLFVAWTSKPMEGFALVGSANLTARGIYHNIELGLMIYSWDHGETIVEDLYKWGAFDLRTKARKLR